MAKTFKTNINCKTCLSKVKPLLDEQLGEYGWSVDLTDPNRYLSIKSSGFDQGNLLKSLQSIGFKAEELA